ncbi:plexin domain-containing protein 2 [Achroia grisella]|uniref:plexin domain-containing protein 2 n=1 Tax=Achroia grisella TaxID=688607 RepID=UPI0027D247DF|nr:plexin domain-containing protein 2 [Achroia grisella]
MDFLKVKFISRSCLVAFLFVICLNFRTHAWNTEYRVVGGNGFSGQLKPHIMTLDHSRYRRDVVPTHDPAAAQPTEAAGAVTATAAANSTSSATSAAPAATVPSVAPPAANVTAANSKMSDGTQKPTVAGAVVTQVPLLGVNGSGIRHMNGTEKTTTVSEPIMPDDNLNITEILEETPEMIKSEHNLANLTYDNHDFYNSSFIGNVTFFKEHWENITKPPADEHAVLSNSHRRATAVVLKFPFPFYGQIINNITVATGGFMYTGDHAHSWLAATQYIAPLMANFDTTLTNDSVIKMSDDGEKFTAFWENVSLQENAKLKFTFAATLYKNGDIVFAYKDIPLTVQQIDESMHPVKVGISDAYITDKIMFYVRRKTIYEYHRANFKNYLITNNTILRLTALPTCMQYDNCQNCINHNTAFNCSWCSQVQKCSSGTDKNKQDWTMRHCDKLAVTKVSACPASPAPGPLGGSTAYVTGSTDAVIHAFDDQATPFKTRTSINKAPVDATVSSSHTVPEEGISPVGGVVAAFVTVAIVCSIAAWTVYAFRNPHTRSGQLLIKYRPSQWSWRRGEARYTAATIHM